MPLRYIRDIRILMRFPFNWQPWCWCTGVSRVWAKGAQFPGRRITMGLSNYCRRRQMRRKVPTMSQKLSSIQYICFRQVSSSNMWARNLLLAAGAIKPRYTPAAAGAVSMMLTPLPLPFAHHNHPFCDGCAHDAEKNRVRNKSLLDKTWPRRD